MPRRHSSMGVLQPAKNETLTNARVQANNLDQEAVVFHELSELVNNVVQTQYVDNIKPAMLLLFKPHKLMILIMVKNLKID